MTTLADRFDAAFAAVERGWCRGRGRTPDGGVCLVVSIDEQIDGEWRLRKKMNSLARELLGLQENASLVEWNDAHGRRKRSVLRLLDTCARVCRERGL